MAETGLSFEPADEIAITDLETLRLVSDPLRTNILREMMAEPCTVKQVAERLSLPPTKLYYHVNLLEARGLIRVVGTRVVSGIIEKRYRSVARKYIVDRSLFTPDAHSKDEVLEAVLRTTLDTVRREIQESAQSGAIDLSVKAPDPHALYMRHGIFRLTEERAQMLYTRLDELLREFSEPRDVPDVETSLFGLLFALYPTKVSPPAASDSAEGASHR